MKCHFNIPALEKQFDLGFHTSSFFYNFCFVFLFFLFLIVFAARPRPTHFHERESNTLLVSNSSLFQKKPVSNYQNGALNYEINLARRN